jgi:hypothetical protein
MTDRSFQTAIAAMCFSMVTIVAGAWTLEAAKATVNMYQERQAEALCKVDPSYCGQTR